MLTNECCKARPSSACGFTLTHASSPHMAVNCVLRKEHFGDTTCFNKNHKYSMQECPKLSSGSVLRCPLPLPLLHHYWFRQKLKN